MVTRDEELKWAYLLDPCFELTNSAGKPLTDGYIEVYIAGTRNKYYCASDFSGTLHPFQIPLDSLGSNIVLANPDNAYDVYVYNRYGNLIMSRYNVTPADGGAVISNTERINELEDTLVSAVTGLQGQIDDINDALENKKDKQEPYSVTLTPTQTVSAIIQNENGEMEVIYQEIDLPEEVPNVDIVSPASTISITTHIDEETNTKTFSIDLSDLGHLEYGQYMATEDVITGANMYRIKGNLDTTLDGKIKLHKGNSYHITVRGAYVCTDINNTVNTLDYIEYSTFTPFHVDVDNTVTDPQNFEISYDIFKLSNDTNYYIAFAASAGKVSNLTVEIHSLSNLSILDPDFKYQEGWGINIVSSVISVDPDIFNDYTTHTDVYESIVTAIDFVTGAMPATQVQSDWDETDESSPAYIQNKPDLDIYATHDEVNTVSGEIIETVNNVSSVLHEEITNNNDTVIETINNVSGILHEEIIETAQVITGLIPDVSDFTTHEDVNSAIVTAIEYVTGIIPDAQVQSDWNQDDDTQPDYINNKPDLDIYATHDEVNTVSGQIVEIVNNVSGDIIETVNNVSGILHGEIENIPEQQQADWDQTDDTQVDYIKNKPDLSIYATHDEVTAAVSSIDLSEYATHTEVYDSSVTAIQLVTGLIPDVSDFTTHDEVHESIVSALEYVTGIIPDAQVQSDWTETDTTDPAYIKHKPNQTELVAGQNIGIFDNGSTLTIAASGTDLTGYATETEVNSAIVTAINYVTGIIPDAQVQSNWEETNTSDPSYIQNKPDLSVYMTEEQVMEIVTGVTGLTEYGQFYATAVSGAAVMARTKGTIGVTNDGKIQLKKGSSYHVTVRGRYNQTTPNNVYSSISYIEYITNNNININVDKSITEAQYFEISYDLYKLNSDSNYYVFFSGLEGTVNDLYIEIHALDGIGGNGGSVTGAAEYDAGWGIQILNNVISVNPSIIPDDINLVAGTNIGIMVSGNDLVIAASGSDLSDYATLEQLQDSVELVTGLIPDTSDLATKAELQDGLELVTGLIPDVSNLATKSELQDGLELVTGLIPTIQLNESNLVTSINNYPIYSEGGAGTTYTAGDGIDITNNIISVDNTVALKTDIPDVSDLATKAELQDGLELVTGLIPDVTNYATHAEVNNVSGAIVDLIPELPEDINLVAGQNIGIVVSGNDIVISASGSDMSDYVTEEELIEAVTVVTAAIPAAQVQSNWNETNVSSPAYIQNKPTIPSIEGLATVAQVSAVSGYLQSEIDNIPAQVQSDWTEDDNTDPAYIQNKPDQVRLVAGQNITIVDDVDIVTISASVPSVTGFATKEELQDGLELVTGLIPDVTDFATTEDVQDAVELVTGLIPDISNLATKNELNAVETEVQAVSAAIPELPDEEEVEFEEIDLSDYALASAIPDVSNFATKTELQDGLELVTGLIPNDYVTNEALQDGLELVTGLIPTDYVTDEELQDAVEFVTGLIPDTSSFATHAEVNNVSGAIVNEIPDVSEFVTESQVTALLPEEEDVEFEEIDLSDYALASAIPDISDLATKSELQDGLELVTGLIPSTEGLATVTEVQVVSGYLQNEIDNIPGGTEYTAGDHIGIVNDEISVTGITELVAGNAITITTSGVSAIISSTGEAQVQSDWNETNSSSKAYIKNKPTIPAAQVQSNWNETNTSSKAYIQNKPTIHNYTGASGVVIDNNVITLDNPIGLVAGDNITIEVSGVSAIISAQGGGSTYSAGNGIDITSDVISIDNTVALKTDIPVVTGYIPYSASGVELPNSNFKIDPDGQAYKSGSQSTETIIANESAVPDTFYASFPAVPKDKIITFTFDSIEGIAPAILRISDLDYTDWKSLFVNIVNNTASFSISSDSAIASGEGICLDIMTSDDSYLSWSNLVNPKVAYTDTVSYNIPYVTQTELDVVTGLIPEVPSAGNMLSVSNDTLNVTTTAGITDIQLVNALPASPVSSVLYLIPEV